MTMMFLMIGKRETKSNMELFQYEAEVIRVIDGDTIIASISLGFDVYVKKRIRFQGFNAPESRTRDKTEKVFGLAAKARLKELLGKSCVLKTQVGKGGEDMKGKFGRTLGDFLVDDKHPTAGQILIQEGHAVAYEGQAKEDIESAHLANRQRLIKEGKVNIK